MFVRFLLALLPFFASSSAYSENRTQGTILAFYGASSSGKTSLIKELKKKYKMPITELGLDLQIQKMLLQLEESEYKEEFRNAVQFFPRVEIFTALVRKEVDIPRSNVITILSIDTDIKSIKANALQKGIQLTHMELSGIKVLKDLVEKSHNVFCIENLNYEQVFIEMFKDMIEHSRNGETVLIDLAPISYENFIVRDVLRNTLTSENYQAHARMLLVLCPFKLLVDRIRIRNKIAQEQKNYMDLREGVFPLFQYAQIFKTSNSTEAGVDSIHYQDLVEAVEVLWPKPNKAEILERLANQLGIVEQNREYPIQTRDEYDYVFVNDKFDSQITFVDTLVEILHRR